MGRLLDENDVYALFARNRTAQLHVADIDALPRVDAVEVAHSKWDTVFYERNETLASYSHICPECKYFYRDLRFKGHNYCPNCGAKMDLEG